MHWLGFASLGFASLRLASIGAAPLGSASFGLASLGLASGIAPYRSLPVEMFGSRLVAIVANHLN